MTWMKHAEHGGVADLPDLPYWRAQGWEPTDERPTEPDLTRDPPAPAEVAAEPDDVAEDTEAMAEDTAAADTENEKE